MKKLIFLLTLIAISCVGGDRKSATVPLDKLDGTLRERAETIKNDFFQLAVTPEGLREFREKTYITPMAHRSLIEPRSSYALAPLVLLDLGEIYSITLFEVVDKGVVKKMRYKIDCERRKDEFVEFSMDINGELKLSKMYLYLSIEDKAQNVFDGAYLKF